MAIKGGIGGALAWAGAVTAPTGFGIVLAVGGGLLLGWDAADDKKECDENRDSCYNQAPA
jgi:hypothetical protein